MLDPKGGPQDPGHLFYMGLKIRYSVDTQKECLFSILGRRNYNPIELQSHYKTTADRISLIV